MTRYDRRWVIAGMMAMLSVPVAIARAAAQEMDLSTRLVVMIEGELNGGPSTGAGLIYGRDGDRIYIVTANHVVRRGGQEASRIRILLRQKPEQWVPARLAPEADPSPPGLDLAVIVAEGLGQIGVQACGLTLDRMGDPDSLARGSGVYPVGYPGGAAWGSPVTPDHVAQVVGSAITFQSAVVTKGHSGGSLLTEDGNIVGLIRLDEPPFGVATRVDRVLDVLRKWPYRVDLRKAGTPSPLFAAVVAQDLSALERLAREPCADVNQRFDGVTPLQAAADTGAAGIVAALLRVGAAVDLPAPSGDDEQSSPLQLAAAGGHLETVKALLKAHPNLEYTGQARGTWLTALERAVNEGHRDVALAIRGAGARTDFVNRLEVGSPHESPLHRAAAAGNTERVRLLLEFGADVNRPDQEGATPLYRASDKSDTAIVKLLLAARANPSTRTAGDRSPLYEAIISAWQQAFEGARAETARGTGVQVARLLVKAGADVTNVEGKGENRRTAMGMAAEYGAIEIVEYLLDSGVDPNQGDGKGRTALHYAAEMPGQEKPARAALQIRLIRLLLAKGAKVSAPDAKGDPPLCRALWGNPANPRITIVDLLLKAGSRPVLQDDCKGQDGRSWVNDEKIESLIRSYMPKRP